MTLVAGARENQADMPLWTSWVEHWVKPVSGPLGMGLLRLLGPRTHGTLGILMYHRVAPITAGFAPPTWNVTPDRFRHQLQGLLQMGYQGWSLRQALAHNRTGQPFPARVFVITFDDGYENLIHHAWPVLRDLRLPATVFVATSYLDSQVPFPFDKWKAAGSLQVPVESWRPLTSDQCREMAADGLIEIGAHTHTHADFRNRPAEFMADLRASVDVLAERFGFLEPTFAFPYGRRKLGFAGPPLSEAARNSGVICALTTESDLNRSGSDPFDWGRFTVTQADLPATISTKLSGWYAAARFAWRLVGQPRWLARRQHSRS